MAGFVRYGERNINLNNIIYIDINIPSENMKPCVYFNTINDEIKYWFFKTEEERNKVFEMLLEHMTNIEL